MGYNYRLEAIRARIRELEQKLYYTTSMSAEDRYQAELTGLYEEEKKLEAEEEKDS